MKTYWLFVAVYVADMNNIENYGKKNYHQYLVIDLKYVV